MLSLRLLSRLLLMSLSLLILLFTPLLPLSLLFDVVAVDPNVCVAEVDVVNLVLGVVVITVLVSEKSTAAATSIPKLGDQVGKLPTDGIVYSRASE